MFEPDQLPTELAAVLTGVRALSTDQLAAATAQERAGYLVGLRQLVDTAEAHFLHVLATFDAHGDGEVLAGARSTTSWLRGALHLSGADAGGRGACQVFCVRGGHLRWGLMRSG